MTPTLHDLDVADLATWRQNRRYREMSSRRLVHLGIEHGDTKALIVWLVRHHPKYRRVRMNDVAECAGIDPD